MLLKHTNIAALTDKGFYFLPAILECASKDELLNKAARSDDPYTPFPIKLTFKSGIVPTGLFCGVITRLASEAEKDEESIGKSWNLSSDSHVKRNLVTFKVNNHTVTLVAHVDCYEIRLQISEKQRGKINVHKLCSYVLTTILFILKEINSKIKPIIAFDCMCPKHGLCKLNIGSGSDHEFICDHKCIDNSPPENIDELSPQQKFWFEQEVKLNEDVVLCALDVAKSEQISFKWMKDDEEIEDQTGNKLRLKNVSKAGFYTCEVYKKDKDKKDQLCFKTLQYLKIIDSPRDCKRAYSTSDDEISTKIPQSDSRRKYQKRTRSTKVHSDDTVYLTTNDIQEANREALRSASPKCKMAEGCSVDDIKLRTGIEDTQLDTRIEEKQLWGLANLLDNYEKYIGASGFGLSKASKTDLKAIATRLDNRHAMVEAFKMWFNAPRPDVITYRSLIEILIDLNKVTEAEDLCKFVARKVPSSKPKHSATRSETSSRKRSHDPASDEELPKAKVLHSGPKSDDPPPSQHPRADPELIVVSSEEEDENNEELQQFCTAGEDILEQEDTGPLNVPGALPGSARRHLLWDVKQIPKLKVHFLNPELLEKEKWMCGSSQLTTNNVLDWADVWNSHADHYPKISDGFATKEKAQIRVLFTSDKKCRSWSKVGTAATWETDTKKPTMVLKLRGMTKAEQRSMVIHEFGHSLGLDHEHQRSDFWDVLEQKDEDGQFRFIIEKDQMKDGIGCQRASAAVFRADLTAPQGTEKTVYNSQSIMHYWFDKNWLQPEYRDLKDVKKNQTLTDRERKVLEGVHVRDYRTGGIQAEKPSKLDYETLNKAYGAPSQQEEDGGPSQNTGVSHGPTPPSIPSAKNSEMITDITLTVNDTMTLLDVLQEAQEKWHYIGKGIGVSDADLTQIDHSYRPDTLRCLDEIIKRRIQRGGLTRSMLCQCLRGKFVKRDDVAQKIEALKLN